MYFTIEKAQKYLSDLANYIYVEQIVESLKHWPEDLPLVPICRSLTIAIGLSLRLAALGRPDQTHWFRRSMTIPE